MNPLIDKAKRSKRPVSIPSGEEIELAFAVLRGEISVARASMALDKSLTNGYSVLFTILSRGVRANKIVLMTTDEVTRITDIRITPIDPQEDLTTITDEVTRITERDEQ